MIGGGPQKITVEIGGKLANSLKASLRSAQMQVSSFGRNVTRTMNDAATAGRKSFKGILDSAAWQGAAIGAAGIGVALAGSLRTAASFEAVLSDIGKTSGASSDQLKGISKQLLALSGRNVTNLAPQKLAEGLQDLVAQGLELPDAVASLEALGKVATATNSDLLDVTKTGFQLQNALKIRPTELKATFDALAFAGKQGAFELKDMAQFMPTIAAAAGSLGIKGKEGAVSLAAMMQMVRKDAPDAGQAATRLTDAMLKMTAPDAVKNFKKFGVNIEQVLKDAKKKGINPMEAALDELQRVTGGDTFKLAQIFGDKEAKLALMSLMKYRKEYDKLKADAGGKAAAGTVDRDYQRSLATFQGTLASFQNSTQRLGIALGNALLPALTSLATAITPLMEGFADFAANNPAIATGIVAITGAIAGLVVIAPFVSSLVSIFTTLSGAIAGAGGAGAVFGGIMAAVTGPVGLTVLAIVGIGAALVAAYNHFDWFRNAVNGWASGVMQVFSGIGQYISNLWGLVVGIFTGDTAKITQSFNGMGEGLKVIWSGIVQGFTAVWGGVGQGAMAAVQGIWQAFLSLPTIIGNIFKGLATVAQLAFGALLSGLTSLFGNIIAGVQQAFSQVVAAIPPIVPRILAILFPLPAMIIRLFTNGGIGQKIVGTIIDGLKAKAGALFGWVTGAWNKIKGLIGQGDQPSAASPAAATPPGRATGGPVRAGHPYIVGERRRELFVPGMDGAIIPRVARPVTGGGGGVTINAPITIHAAGGNAMEIRDQVRAAFEDLMAMASSGYRVALND